MLNKKKKDDGHDSTELRKFREKAGFSLTAVCKASGVDVTYLSRIETNKMKLGELTIERLKKGYSKLKKNLPDSVVKAQRAGYKKG